MIFCGMPFSGKSTIGRLVAEKLSLPFIDTDTLFEKPPRILFREIGEASFRAREREILFQLKGGVIALGGGSLYFSDVAAHLKSLGKIYYLETPFETLFSRMGDIPSYLDKNDPRGSFEALYFARTPIFERVCTKKMVTSGKSVEQIVQEIVNGE